MKAIPIWSPRYWDKKVLIDRLKLNPTGKTYLFFCCDKNLTSLYSVDSSRVRAECGLCTNGKILCYQVPLEWLENEGDLPSEFIPIRDKNYNKYKASKLKK